FFATISAAGCSGTPPDRGDPHPPKTTTPQGDAQPNSDKNGKAIQAVAHAKPLTDEIVSSWKAAGCKVGWMGFDLTGGLRFQADQNYLERCVPAFQFNSPADLKGADMSKLPAPAVPFGLSLTMTQASDGALPALGKFSNLRFLDLTLCMITDEGL